MSIRMTPANRKAAILAAAMTVAASKKIGFSAMRQKDIAEQAECGFGTVTLYFNTMTQMRRAVMREAIKQQDVAIIAQGLGIGDPDAKKAPPELKKKAAALLAQ